MAKGKATACKLCGEPVWPNRSGLVRCEAHYHEYMREANEAAAAKRKAERAATLPEADLCQHCGAPRDMGRRGRICRDCYNERRAAAYHGGEYETVRYERFAAAYDRLHVYALIERSAWQGRAG